MKTKREFQQRRLSVIVSICIVFVLLPFLSSCGKSENPLEKEKQAFQNLQKRAIEKEPVSAEDYKNRGDAYSASGNVKQAISDYTKAIEINPNDGEAYNNRAVMYFGEREYAKAKEDVRRAQALGYKVSPQLLENLNGKATVESTPRIGKEKFKTVYNFAKELEYVSNNYYTVVSALNALSSEIALVKEKVSTDDERQLLAFYQDAVECYEDGIVLWKIADECKYEEDNHLRYHPTADDKLRYLDIIKRSNGEILRLSDKYGIKYPLSTDYLDVEDAFFSKPIMDAASVILEKGADKLRKADKVIVSD